MCDCPPPRSRLVGLHKQNTWNLFYPGPLTDSKEVLETYSTPGPHKQQGGVGDLFYPRSPQTARGCWGPILPQVPTNSKGVLGTYSTPGPHKQQGGVGDLFYPRSPQTARGCWGPILPQVPTNSKCWPCRTLIGLIVSGHFKKKRPLRMLGTQQRRTLPFTTKTVSINEYQQI